MKKHLRIFATVALLVASGTVSAQTGNTGIGTSTPGSKLTVNGSLAAAYTSVTANAYAVGENDFTIRWSGTADGTVTLPASIAGADRTGRLYYFKNASSAFTLTIDANGTELIDDGATVLLQPGEGALLAKTNDNTATGSTYLVIQLSQTQQPYMYTITSTGNQTVAQGVLGVFDLSTVEFSTNGGGDFNAATESWTCPQSGWYRVEGSAQASAATAGSHCSMLIQKNTVSQGSNIFFVPTSVSNSGSVSRVLNLVQGDQIRIAGVPCSGCGSPSITFSTRRMEISRL